jgi:hypothetical protein
MSKYNKKYIVLLAEDGKTCNCSCADRCPLGREGSELRCTLAELITAGVTIVTQDDWRELKKRYGR